VALCVYADDGISAAEVHRLVDDAWRDEEPLYQLRVFVTSVTPWSRPAFTMNGILEALVRQPLAEQCDRVLALIGRNAGDVIFGLFLPEVLGAVHDKTLTHGYVVARRASLNQLLLSPLEVTRHEIYHLLGCHEHFNMPGCYQQIALLKRWKQTHHTDFFPAWDAINSRLLTSRNEVNARLSSSTLHASGSIDRPHLNEATAIKEE
jgi:hypothetical protein